MIKQGTAINGAQQRIKEDGVKSNDGETKFKILKGFLMNAITKEGIELKLGRKEKINEPSWHCFIK